jgi:hypothetical protein
VKRFAKHLDDLERREFIAGIAKASLGVSVLPALAGAAETPSGKVLPHTAKNVIFVYMAGGMPHVDTFDPKTNSEVKGQSSPIKTSAAGVQVSNFLPEIAKQADKMAILRGMSTKTGDHAGGNYLMHTAFKSRPGISHPQLGSWAQFFLGRPSKTMPASVVVGGGNPGPGFFPPDHSPFPIGDPSKGIRELLPKIDRKRFDHRVELARKFGGVFEQRFPNKDVNSYSQFYDETVKFFDDSTVSAFNINKESAKTRALYGDSKFGKGLLLARRLVEHSVRYVEVQLGGWDGQHNGLEIGARKAGELDGPFAALLADLDARGLLGETMVVLTTEFGRTPKVSKRGGRDHFPKAFSAVLAGGGVNGGQVIGETDAKATEIKSDKFGPEDLHSTIAYALGLNIEERIHGSGGRPFFVGNRGKVIKKAFA